jgi:hypothetical protein
MGALFAFKFAVLMTDSALFGRIAIPPVYDDVSYFIYGLQRLDVFRHAAVPGLLGTGPAIINAVAAAIVE